MILIFVVLFCFVVPGVSSPKGSSPFVLRVLSLKRSSSSFLRVLSPKGSWGGVNSAALASGLFLGVLSPKGSWGGVDVVALASGCWTAIARRWAIRLIAADSAV